MLCNFIKYSNNSQSKYHIQLLLHIYFIQLFQILEAAFYQNLEISMNQEYTKLTLEKVETAKRYIEKKYAVFIKEEKQKAEYLKDIEKRMIQFNFSKKQIKQVKTSLSQFETLMSKFKRMRVKIEDFEHLAIIGKGSFGEVRLCRDKYTKDLVAIKRLSKKVMVERKQISHVSLEKEILSTSSTNFVIELKGCFQDDEYLYFVMEYLSGGDFMNLLIKQDVLEEKACRFYMAQIILAVEYLHKMGYIHRDLKPDNILMGANGHIKLIDFGLVKYGGIQVDNKQQPQLQLKKLHKAKQIQARINRFHKRVYSRVGTPQYIAPEVLTNSSYDQRVDWWSVGIIFYQMLFGFTPFSAQTPKQVCYNITNWKQYLQYPEDINVSIEAMSLLNVLLCDSEKRYTAEKIRNHRFFKGINWNQVEHLKPPFILKIESETDTSNFESFPDSEPWSSSVQQHAQKDYNFVDFDYKKPPDINILQIIDNQIDQIRAKAPRQSRPSTKKRIETSTNLRSTMAERCSSPKLINLKRKDSVKKKKTNQYLMTEPCENMIM